MPIARSLTGVVNLNLTATHLDYAEETGQAARLDQPIDKHVFPYLQQLAYGTATNAAEINLMYHDRRLIAAPEEIDLAGVLLDRFGGTLTFTKVKVLALYNDSATIQLHVLGTCTGGDQVVTMTSIGAEHIVVPPKGTFLLTAPLAGFGVTAGVADKIRVAPGGPSLYMNILVLGVGLRSEDDPTTTTAAATTVTTP